MEQSKIIDAEVKSAVREIVCDVYSDEVNSLTTSEFNTLFEAACRGEHVAFDDSGDLNMSESVQFFLPWITQILGLMLTYFGWQYKKNIKKEIPNYVSAFLNDEHASKGFPPEVKVTLIENMDEINQSVYDYFQAHQM